MASSKPAPRMIVTHSGETRPEDFYDRLAVWSRRAAWKGWRGLREVYRQRTTDN